MPGRAGRDRVPVNDPAFAGSFVCGIKSPEKYNRTITGDSASIFPLLATLLKNAPPVMLDCACEISFSHFSPGQPLFSYKPSIAGERPEVYRTGSTYYSPQPNSRRARNGVQQPITKSAFSEAHCDRRSDFDWPGGWPGSPRRGPVALASQCQAALMPVQEAVRQHKMPFLDAEDVMSLIEHFDACTPEKQQRASSMRSEIHSLGETEQRRSEEEAKEKAAEDARIQRNALKMLDLDQAKELTLTEREEVYRRSLKQMGLKEDGPMTPAQKDMVQRMYRTMVLGESGKRPPTTSPQDH